jgi:enamine deaminase RidA (YjgF/YER057c/UK114 family)
MNNTTFGIVMYSGSNPVFSQTIHLLVNQFEQESQILRITFFGDGTNENYEDKITSITDRLTSSFSNNIPLFSFVVQPTSNPDEVLAEVIYLQNFRAGVVVNHKILFETPYITIEDEQRKILFIEGVRCTDFSETIAIQGVGVFKKIASIFEKESLQIHDIVRQWNYIGNITGTTCEKQHYQAFNESRAQFYDKTDWHLQGYPAATGIGMSIQGLLISLIAFSDKTKKIRVIPIDNPLQVAAHHYSQSKLIGKAKNIQLATPKFERAKIILDNACGLCFVSGTAAIRGEESMHCVKADLQTRQTIENINFLISALNLQHFGITNFATTVVALRVYYKENEDYDAIKSEVEKHWFDIPTVYTRADICRNELLVEIEGIVTLDYKHTNTHDT